MAHPIAWLADAARSHALVAASLGGGLVAAVVTTALIAFPAADTVRLSITPPDTALSMENMAPGDSVRGTVTVTNAGTLSLRYAMHVVVEDDVHGLADQMHLTVTAADDSDDGCPSGAEELYSGSLASGAIGDARLGPDPGDRVLAVGGAERLCLEAVYLPSASAGVQAASGTVTFAFSAEGPADP